jgi:hypothetical protein
MEVTPTEALAVVIEAGKTGRFWITVHAREEAAQASATRYDVQNALRTAQRALHQSANGRFRVEGGTDVDGDELVLIVAFEGNVVVVTVF